MLGNADLVAYGCGSPVRLPVVRAMATGSGARSFVPDAHPAYLGGHSLIWGLIRGAPELMSQTRAAGCDFYQMDNAYFGRDHYFRVTRNALQQCTIRECDGDRLDRVFHRLGLTLHPWKAQRNGPILLCPSSEFLFRFYGTTAEKWVADTVAAIRRHTDRPIALRPKQLDGIDVAVRDAHCVVTHVSAAALDALRIGVPVMVTAACAATPLATPMCEIDAPRSGMDRLPLFSSLAWGQFTIEEMVTGFAWKALERSC